MFMVHPTLTEAEIEKTYPVMTEGEGLITWRIINDKETGIL